MTAAVFRRLWASAERPEALAAQQRQEARGRGRLTGLLLAEALRRRRP